tara:strand:- start:247 stop:759 length:513 start_codon:yes stop_codon:yes gene_type:complete
MAINYQNAFKEVINTLAEIITNETKLPCYFDTEFENRNAQYFNLKPIQTSSVSRFSGGATREYEIEIRYYLKKGNYGKVTHLDLLTNVGERITRLFNDKSNATSVNDLFQGVLAQFSQSQDSFADAIAYSFHDGRIESTTYQPDRDESEESSELHIVEFEFLAVVTEVYK